MGSNELSGTIKPRVPGLYSYLFEIGKRTNPSCQITYNLAIGADTRRIFLEICELPFVERL